MAVRGLTQGTAITERSPARKCQEVVGPNPVLLGAEVLRIGARRDDVHVGAVTELVLDVRLAVLVLNPVDELSLNRPGESGDFLV